MSTQKQRIEVLEKEVKELRDLLNWHIQAGQQGLNFTQAVNHDGINAIYVGQPYTAELDESIVFVSQPPPLVLTYKVQI